VSPSYLCMLVAVNISVYVGSIQVALPLERLTLLRLLIIMTTDLLRWRNFRRTAHQACLGKRTESGSSASSNVLLPG
jgi:hypothetical protein